MNEILSKIYLQSSMPLATESLLNKLHVCTVASKETKDLNNLLKSCCKNNIDLKILGLNKPYFSHSLKLFYVQEYLNTLADDDILMFVDAYDVLIISEKNTILKKFFQMKTPLLFAAEKNCWPLDNVADRFPKSPTPFRYIKTGTYIGYVYFLKKWLQDLSPIDIYKCDQSQISLHYLQNPNTYPLDFYCELFLPLFKVRKKELKVDLKTIHCLSTNSRPCVIHANGKINHKLKMYNHLITS
jgi:hypothetical protein